MRRRDFITLLGGAATRPLSFTLLSLAIAVSGPEPTKAHDIYSALKDRGGVSCCSEHDCRPAHYRFTPAGVQMLVSGEWIAVPDETIQYRTLEGDTGETAWGHWCGLTSFVTLTYCAILPPSSAYSSPRADEVIE
jgi:hypothetical protein